MAESYANLLPDTLGAIDQGQRFVDQQFNRARQREAGGLYANGDRAGAGRVLARGGDIQSAAAIENNEIERFKEQYSFVQQKAAPFLAAAVQQGANPVEAFDQLVPDLKRLGTDDNYIASLRQGFEKDPRGMLQMLGQIASVKPRFEKSGQNIIIFDENTGQEIGRVDAPEKTPDPVNVPDGGTLIDPQTGRVIYRSQKTFAPQRPRSSGGGNDDIDWDP